MQAACRMAMILAVVAAAMVTTVAWAQPPALINFQGRLTTTAGAPITTVQVVFFSVYQGGTAGLANSGTLLYREQATVTPDATGVFTQQIGSGTVVTGSLDPNSFITTQPVFLQADVNSLGNTLLPRTRFTSVGYAFVANQATFANAAGRPRVSAVIDLTGGVVVIGDMIRIQGSGLANAEVSIGGIQARIKSRSDAQVDCQVPAGIRMGLNPLTVSENGNGFAAVTVALLNVHRLLVLVTPGSNPQVVIFDALTLQKVTDINLGVNLTTNDPIISLHSLQVAFADQGALALIPANSSNQIFGIDLTKNPPAVVDTTISFNGGRGTAVAVSPDDKVAVISDTTANGLSTLFLNEVFPPFTSNLFGLSQDFFIDRLGRNFKPSAFNSPRGSTFVGNGLYMVCSSGSNELYAFRRDPVNPKFFFFYRPLNAANAFVVNRVSAGTQPFAMRLTNDRTSVLVTTRSALNLQSFFIGPEGFQNPSTGVSSVAAGANAGRATVGPSDETVFIADSGADSGFDLLHEFNSNKGTLTPIGDLEDNHINANPSTLLNAQINPIGIFYNLAAIEPVEGKLLLIGTTVTASNPTASPLQLNVFNRDGSVVSFLKNIATLATGARWTYALDFQP